MPKLNDIATYINGQLVANIFTGANQQPVKLDAIADYVMVTDKESSATLPFIVDNFGEMKQLTFDDTNTIQGYHVIKGIDYETNGQMDFGDPDSFMQETATIKMVFFGNRVKLKIRPEDFIAAVSLYMPKQVDLNSLGIIGYNLNINNIEHVSHRAWDEEFNGIEYDLPPNIFMSTITYTIRTIYGKNCFSIC